MLHTYRRYFHTYSSTHAVRYRVCNFALRKRKGVCSHGVSNVPIPLKKNKKNGASAHPIVQSARPGVLVYICIPVDMSSCYHVVRPCACFKKFKKVNRDTTTLQIRNVKPFSLIFSSYSTVGIASLKILTSSL